MQNEAVKSALKQLREEMLKKMFNKMDKADEAKLEVSVEAEKEDPSKEKDSMPESESEDSGDAMDMIQKALMDDYYKTEARKKRNAEEPGFIRTGLLNPKINPKSFEGPKKKGK